MIKEVTLTRNNLICLAVLPVVAVLAAATFCCPAFANPHTDSTSQGQIILAQNDKSGEADNGQDTDKDAAQEVKKDDKKDTAIPDFEDEPTYKNTIEVKEDKNTGPAKVGFKEVGKVLFSLLIVIALIIGTVYVIKYFYSRSMKLDIKGHEIRVIDMVQLGVGRALYLVKIGERVILLGTSDKGLTYLSDVSGDVDLASYMEQEQAAEEKPGFNFKRQLNEAFGFRKNAEKPEKDPKLTHFNSKLKDRLKRLEDEEEPKKT